MSELVLGTRGSLLATTQSRGVARALTEQAGAEVELQIIRTRGDEIQDRPLPEIGGKGLFTAELDRALLDGRIHLAVHSLKDLPTDAPPGLTIACIPEREDPRDVLVGPAGSAVSLEGLPDGAVLGTSSLRRKAMARAFRPDLEIRDVRDEGLYDALVLAAAGIRRLGKEERIGEWLERTAWLPAPGQGALGIVTRADDDETRALLAPLNDPATEAAVRAERALLARLEGGCQVPIAALGLPYGPGLRLWGLVASTDGRRVVRADRTGSSEEPEALGIEVAEILLERGAGDILSEVEDVRPPPRP